MCWRSVMRKFVKNNKRVEFEIGEEDERQSTSGDHDIALAAKTVEIEAKTRKIANLEEENRRLNDENLTLKNSLQKMLNENLNLKDSAAAETSEKFPLDGVNFPNWNEIAHLVNLVSQENDHLLKFIKSESVIWADVKAEQSNELEKLRLKASDFQRKFYECEKQLKDALIDVNRLQTELHIITESYKSTVPLSEHKEATTKAETLLRQLKEAYTKQISNLKSSLLSSQSELRKLTLQVATIEAESKISHENVKRLTKELNEEKADNVELRKQFEAVVHQRDEAKQYLARIVLLKK